MKRQTDLCLGDIFAYLEQSRLTGGCGCCHGGSLPYPPCLLVNELGVFAIDEKNKEAEAKLCEILEYPQDELRAIAYVALFQVPDKDQKTFDAMWDMHTRPENKDLLDWADEQIKSQQGAS